MTNLAVHCLSLLLPQVFHAAGAAVPPELTTATLACGDQYSADERSPGFGDSIILPVLRPGYTISIGPVARIGSEPVDMYLLHNCRVIKQIQAPQDFAGFVSIKTSADCLAFLRLFSLPMTYYLFRQDPEEIEIFAGTKDSDTDSGCGNIVSAALWIRHGMPTVNVRSATEGEMDAIRGRCGGPCQSGFVVQRPVLLADDRICYVTQVVCDDGRFLTLAKEPLDLRGEALGLLFFRPL
ncbi:MAG: hypothetical protein AB1646_26660 [Thermodesulfobacteriota bacterium]